MDSNEEVASSVKSSSVQIPSSIPRSFRSSSPRAEASSRETSIARLASPLPANSYTGTPSSVRSGKRIATPVAQNESLATINNKASLPGPGTSALASALQDSNGSISGAGPSGTPPRQPPLPGLREYPSVDKPVRSNYGSFDPKSTDDGSESVRGAEDPEVVKRHLVRPPDLDIWVSQPSSDAGGYDDEFSSLQLQGGDVTRQVYRWTEDAEAQASGLRRPTRSRSFSVQRPEPESETMNINSIRVPGGFRRDYIRRNLGSPGPHGSEDGQHPAPNQPRFLTSNFLEFLTLYGHFAGEELEEDDEVLGPGEYFSSDVWEEGDEAHPGESTSLLRPDTPGMKRRKHKERAPKGTNTSMGAALLLLKSFVGTGVLFLPRAFLNGGMLFSSIVLLVVSLVSFYCFILLVNSRLKIEGSFGDIGGILYGKWMRRIILGSIVLSQLGFVAAYIVFTSQNLQAFILAVSKCLTYIDIKFMVLMQLIIFLPLSLIRDISKLGFTALVADVFIMLGLIYLYYYDISTIIDQNGVSDIIAFNPNSWTLFIGTAIFTYEGVGLIIPIQESMKQPKKFPGVLAAVMIIITVIFLSAGAVSYAAYGSATKTVVLLNLPQDDKFVNAVQFLYSLAILLSTPLQLFPAIRICENELFTRSGKYNPGIKWKKNFFRFMLVMFCAFVAWGGAGDLDKFVSLVGSFACVPLVYVYPPLLHLKACATTRFQRSADIGLAVIGVICCIYTTTLTIYNWVGVPPAPEAPGYCDV
ncbi:amino acid transporter, putative [Talaromyces stipitatus ATCC 10500]|uniref:Amino acid transporter, putative n=1 Tax=Talaromyces stipitatus (strain ATCC 10500 / CBS 375.48 / QM 6759 / NRRL 1006) TaxID=441959 RepID=B8MK79_TALSN|nr:amino acid transporter, putative [Talaromyces stipitatus ATCC 10500]EED15234.1 amino acid transporter, putative [Talaromyces stipitatus ATCC 10500]